MFLERIDIKNFRGIKELSLELDDLCVLVGENNSGKSSVLDALRLCMTRPLTRRASVFEEYDYHLDDASAEPSRENPIEITLKFAEREMDEWPDEFSQTLRLAEQIDDEGLRSVILRVRSTFDPHSVEYDFLNSKGNALPKAREPRLVNNLRQLAPVFHLESMRDAGREFRAGASFWGPFVRSIEIDEDAREEIERTLSNLNEEILDQHTAFKTVREHLSNATALLPLGKADPVSIDAVPSRLSDVLSRAQVSLAAKTGARIPIARHGSGTQSLAVICLFDAYLQKQMKGLYGDHAEAILTMEEPEAHLHPSAVKAVGEMLRNLSGQKLLSTHSGDLLASVPLKKIRRLSRKDGKTVVYRIDAETLSDDEIGKLDYHVKTSRGDLLFSRCWLLVEGETDAMLISECARAMDRDLYSNGVSCIEFTKIGVEKFIKLADQMGIEWFVLCDNDPAGENFRKTACGQLGPREPSEHVRLLDHGTMEVFLCMEGFGDIYEKTVSPQKKKEKGIVSEKGTPDYWKEVCAAQSEKTKPRNALDVAQKISRSEKPVPRLLREVVEQSLKLGGSTG